MIGYWLFCAAFGLITLLLTGEAQKIIALTMLAIVTLGVLVWASRPQKDT